MCPLRVILIFLSATIAGFFLLRGLQSQPDFDFAQDQQLDENNDNNNNNAHKDRLPLSTKVGSAICGGFWTLVDMASGRYLWRTLVSPATSSEKKQ